VREQRSAGSLSARAVSADPAVALAVLGRAEDLPVLLEALGEISLPLRDFVASSKGTSFLVPLLNAPDFGSVSRALCARVPSLEFEEGLCLVSVVGDGFASSPEPLLRFLGALAAEGLAPRLTTATALRLSALLPQGASGAAQRALHAAFVSNAT
jgi:aspartate kinase